MEGIVVTFGAWSAMAFKKFEPKWLKPTQTIVAISAAPEIPQHESDQNRNNRNDSKIGKPTHPSKFKIGQKVSTEYGTGRIWEVYETLSRVGVLLNHQQDYPVFVQADEINLIEDKSASGKGHCRKESNKS